MTEARTNPLYPLGSAEYEQDRLIRQAQWLAPYTERVFRAAGIGTGARVLDLGSGVGDVALLLARLVGPLGQVTGIERNEQAIARASARVAEAGFTNVRFTHTDVTQLRLEHSFDAAVGRYILMFLPDPAAVLRSLARLVRPGGSLVFQESYFQPFLEQCAGLPLWRAAAEVLARVMRQTGVNPDAGIELPQIFAAAGLPAPDTSNDLLQGAECWLPEILQSLRPRIEQLGINTDSMGEFETLAERLHSEVRDRNAATPLPVLSSAWKQKPSE